MSIITTYQTDTVTVTPKGSMGGDGRYTYDGTARQVFVKVVARRGIVRREPGKDVGYAYEVYFAPADPVAIQDHVTFGGRTYEVKDIYELDQVDGTHSHKKVRIG